MDILDKAIVFATEKHHGQVRKMSGIPFILHPLEVANIVATMTNDREVISAAVLHDTVEDAGIDPEEINEKFGERIKLLVAAETEKRIQSGSKTETWFIRKETALKELRESSSDEVKMLWLADKLSNLRSVAREFRCHGDLIWEHFHMKDKKNQEWYYRSVLEAVSSLSEYDAYHEYEKLLTEVFKEE